MINRNVSLSQDISRAFNFKSGENINDVYPQVMPVYRIQRKINWFGSLSTTTTSSATVVTGATALAGRDTYVTNITLSVMADATADQTSIRVTGVIDGVTRNLLGFNKFATTAFDRTITIQFAQPLKIDAGTSIGFTNAFTVGASSSLVLVQGYYVETLTQNT